MATTDRRQHENVLRGLGPDMSLSRTVPEALRISIAVLAIACLLSAAPVLGQNTPTAGGAEWTPTTLYSFCAKAYCADGLYPRSGLIFDSSGNLYGTATSSDLLRCNPQSCGMVFKLIPPQGGKGPWTYTVLYDFCQTGGSACTDGSAPWSTPIFDSQGNLYGTTAYGGAGYGYYGTVYELSPPASGNGPWSETVLHSFCSSDPNCTDGAYPWSGVISDSAGNLYGTVGGGGGENGTGNGMIFEVSPPSGGSGAWTYTVLYAPCPGGVSICADGDPAGKLILDARGNLYGTTGNGGANLAGCGGYGCGTVFELSPPASGGGAWTHTVLYSFCSAPNCADGTDPISGVIFDTRGNLYGTTLTGGSSLTSCYGGTGCGVVFELKPPSSGSGTWTESTLYTFCSATNCADGNFPHGLVFDSFGNLYGTTQLGGTNSAKCAGGSCGTVFELSPPSGGGAWTYNVLYSFCAAEDPDCTNGNQTYGGVILDSQGNLYGTGSNGGSSDCAGYGCGTVFELTPVSDFAVAVNPDTVSISSPGQSGSAIITITPQGGFSETVSFICSGMPTGASCSFNPQTVKPSGVAASTTLTISTIASAAATTATSLPVRPPSERSNLLYAICMPLLGLAWLAGALSPARKKSRLLWTLVYGVVLTTAIFQSACGGGSGGGSHGGGGTLPGTYTITVTGTSGSRLHTTSVTLTVQ